MKRMIRVLSFALVFACFVFPALASSFDFSTYTNDELIELETALQAEKINRGLAKAATVYSGIYTVGVDIPAGTYRVETLKGAADHLKVYDKTGRRIGNYAVGTASNRSPIGKLVLEDGYTIEFSDCTLKFIVYSGGISFE